MDEEEHKTNCEQLAYLKQEYTYTITHFTKKNYRKYFDIFILYMIYKFSNPNHIQTKLIPKILITSIETEECDGQDLLQGSGSVNASTSQLKY